jgi:hypothetical protein
MRPALRALPLLLLLLVLAGAGLSAFWVHEERLVRDGLADWTAARRAEGYKIEYGAPDISGFPFTVDVRLDHPTIADPTGQWQWTGDGVEAISHLWSLRDVSIRPQGTQTVSFPQGETLMHLTATAARAEGTLSFALGGHARAIHLAAEKLSLALGNAADLLTAGSASLDIELPEAPAAAQPTGGANPTLPPSAEIATELDDLALPPSVNPGPLGPKLHWLMLRAEIDGAIPSGAPAKALASWRDSGGSIDVKTLDLDWGPLGMTVNATLALDDALQPEGAGTAKIHGFDATIDALMAQHLVKPNEGIIAKAALGLMAQTAPGGGDKVLAVALRVQHQSLFAGPFRLMRLPPVQWAQW